MRPEDRVRFAHRDHPSTHRGHPAERAEALRTVAGGTLIEALCGGAAALIAIIALAGNMPRLLAGIATVAIGAALMAQGASIALHYREVLRDMESHGSNATVELDDGVRAELVGGAIGILLGVLALVGVGGPVLLPIAALVLGVALLLGSLSTVDLVGMGLSPHRARFARSRQAVSDTLRLTGIGAMVLGVLAFAGLAPVVLTLVALLVLGGALCLSGVTVSSRMVTLLRR